MILALVVPPDLAAEVTASASELGKALGYGLFLGALVLILRMVRPGDD